MALHWKILIGMIVGILFGLGMTTIDGGANFVADWINPFGTIFVKLLKLIAVPLIIASLVKGTEYSAAIHPAVAGNITVNLSDVTLDEVLSVVQNMYGYDVIKSGKVIQVYPAGMRTVTIPVDYLQFKRTGRSLTSISTGSVTSAGTSNSGGSSDSSSSSSSSDSENSSDSSTSPTGGTRIETVTESDFWPMLQQAVANLIVSGPSFCQTLQQRFRLDATSLVELRGKRTMTALIQ